MTEKGRQAEGEIKKEMGKDCIGIDSEQASTAIFIHCLPSFGSQMPQPFPLCQFFRHSVRVHVVSCQVMSRYITLRYVCVGTALSFLQCHIS